MDISSINAVASSYAVAGQSLKTATTTQNSNITHTSKSDSVSLSPEALKQSRLEKYPLKDDPIEVFLDWKNNGGDSVILGHVEKPIERLLPENQSLIAQLREQEKTMSPEERKLTEYSRISVIKQYGDKEIFTSAQDADNRLSAISKAATLEIRYLTLKNEKSPINMSTTLQNINLHPLQPINNPTKENDATTNTQPVTEQYSQLLSAFDDKQYLENIIQRLNKTNE